jgi:two-component system chemotaxis response regulator CheY
VLPGKSLILLIVDDHAGMRQLIATIVNDMAERIHECTDGSQALAAYNEYKPDWVLMDIRMNNMDGIAATREIKDAHPDSRIVIVTDYDHPDLRLSAQLAGAYEYVSKQNLLEIRKILCRDGSSSFGPPKIQEQT